MIPPNIRRISSNASRKVAHLVRAASFHTGVTLSSLEKATATSDCPTSLEDDKDDSPVHYVVLDRNWDDEEDANVSVHAKSQSRHSMSEIADAPPVCRSLPCSAFFVAAWALSLALSIKPIPKYNLWAYIIFNGIAAVPLPIFVWLDLVRKAPQFYQLWLWLATWEFSFVVVVNMHMCHYWSGGVCTNMRSFVFLFYWAISPPVISLFAMGQSRIWHLFGATTFVGLNIGLILVQGTAVLVIYRNIVLFIMFHLFIIWVDWLRDHGLRKTFQLRRQLKAQMQSTQSAQAAERNEADARRKFSSYIFHEVRVPLNIGTLCAQNLENEQVFASCTPAQLEMVQGLQQSLSAMETVLNDVLSFDRMNEGAFSLTKAPFDFHHMVNLVMTAYQPSASAAGLQLTSYLDPAIDGLECLFLGDEVRLRQLLSNLVSNSIKFTPEGSVSLRTSLLGVKNTNKAAQEGHDPEKQIALSTVHYTSLWADGRRPSITQAPSSSVSKSSSIEEKPTGPHLARSRRPSGARVRVEVEDTGVGLKQRDVQNDRLWSAYEQSEIGKRQGGKGSGLGLALCLQLVKQFKGRFGVDSRPGAGSCFWFEIPLPTIARKEPTVDSPITISLRKEPEATLPPFSPLNICVVDDDKLTRKLMTHALERAGHRVQQAENGQVGLDLLSKAHSGQGEPFDLVFLDNQMPKMSGCEVVQKLRSLGDRTYVIGATGNALQVDQDEFLNSGVDRILTKPVKVHDMLAAVQTVQNSKVGAV